MSTVMQREMLVLLSSLLLVPISHHALVVGQNLLQNGDFNDGLAHWNPGILDPGSVTGYPKWGTRVYQFRGDPSAFLDAPGGAFAFLDSDFFLLPHPGILTATMWGNHDPVVLGVQVRIETGPIYVLDSFDPPKTEFGQNPVTREYTLGPELVGKSIAIRLLCRSEPVYFVGTFCNFDDVSVTSESVATSTAGPSAEYPILHGQYVDIDWSKFHDQPEVAAWAKATADAQYQYLAGAQGVPSQHIRRSLIHLDTGIGGWAGGGEVEVRVDWFFGLNLASPPESGPSASMSQRDYSLQRLDAELYHEIAHNMAVVARQGYRPSWFTEALGTWAQSSVSQDGAYTRVRAQMEDVFWTDAAYDNPDPFAGYGKGALFLWWLVGRFGIGGLHTMVSQCYGYEEPWISEQDIDERGFLPWTHMTRDQLSRGFYDSVRSGWRVDIRLVVNEQHVPEFAGSPVFTVALLMTLVICRLAITKPVFRRGGMRDKPVPPR
jgi:hypothetical protein